MITTKKRHLSSEPADEQGLRPKYAIITNLWLLALMRQLGRAICRDLDRCTFNDFLDTLLDRDNFNFYKEIEGRALPVLVILSQGTAVRYSSSPPGLLYAIPNIV